MPRWRKTRGADRVPEAHGIGVGISTSRVDFIFGSRAESVGRRPGKLYMYWAVMGTADLVGHGSSAHHAGSVFATLSPTTTDVPPHQSAEGFASAAGA